MLPVLDIRSLTTQGVNPLHFEQYLGVWSVEESAFMKQWRSVTSMDLLSHMKAASVQSAAAVKQNSDARLVQIDIRGTMTKQGSSLSDAGSTVMIRQQIRQAMNDPSVDGVLLVFDTPGGAVAGNMELTNDIWALSQAKPTVTFVEDMMASAGLMAGSQSRKVFANTEGAIVGSMGTYFGMYDMSGAAAKDGVVPVLIKTGDLKGSGFEGLPISEDVKAMWQAIVDESQAGFESVVQRARNLTQAQLKELSRGGVVSAKAGIGLGLIDGIRTYEAAVAELRSMIPAKTKGSKMTTEAPQAATLPELKQACKGADAAFIMAQLEASATVPEAQAAWTSHQNATIAKLQADADKLKAEQDAAIKAKDDELSKLKADAEAAKLKAEHDKKPASGGHKAQPDLPKASEDGELSASEAWDAAIKAETSKGRSLEAATRNVIRNHPDVHRAYVDEATANRPSRRSSRR